MWKKSSVCFRRLLTVGLRGMSVEGRGAPCGTLVEWVVVPPYRFVCSVGVGYVGTVLVGGLVVLAPWEGEDRVWRCPPLDAESSLPPSEGGLAVHVVSPVVDEVGVARGEVGVGVGPPLGVLLPPCPLVDALVALLSLGPGVGGGPGVSRLLYRRSPNFPFTLFTLPRSLWYSLASPLQLGGLVLGLVELGKTRQSIPRLEMGWSQGFVPGPTLWSRCRDFLLAPQCGLVLFIRVGHNPLFMTMMVQLLNRGEKGEDRPMIFSGIMTNGLHLETRKSHCPSLLTICLVRLTPWCRVAPLVVGVPLSAPPQEVSSRR